MKIKIKLILLLFLFLSPALYGQKKQGKARFDSLSEELSKAKDDTNKVNMLREISNALSSYNPQEGLIYGSEGLELAKKIGWKAGEGWMNNSIGVIYLIKTDFNASQEHFNKALKIFEDTHNKKGVGAAISNIGLVNMHLSNYSNALEYFLKALKIDEEIGHKVGMANATANIALIYYHLSNFPKTLEYDFRALKLYSEIGNKSGVAGVKGDIGNVYLSQGNYPKALENCLNAMKIYKELGNKQGVAEATLMLSNIYENQGNYPKSLEHCLEALEIYKELGNKEGVAEVTASIGHTYFNQSNYTVSLDYNLEALKIYMEIGNKEGVAAVTGSIGGNYEYLNNYPKALEYYFKALKLYEGVEKGEDVARITCYIGKTYSLLKNYSLAIAFEQKALKMAIETNDLENIKNCYLYLSGAYDSIGNYKKALDYNNKYQTLKDSIFSKDNGQKIVRLEMQNQYDRQHLADSLKTAEKEQLAAIQLHRQRNYTYMGIAGIMLLLGFSFFIARERSKSEKERKKSDELLLNILPSEIAQELKVTGGSKAQHFDNVTVLFTDFVNFTLAGERMTPQALVDELDTCFKAFDNITGKYNIEKIKTIGDAYLAVCGLPKADLVHAENVVRAALEIKDFMANRHNQLSDKTFEIRIGVHSGNVVAGIVGVKKFAYDIWGDTVNTAARMEQNSEPGKINISETTYALVKDTFTCTYRGEIEAKNKGMLKMYFVS